MKCNRAEKLIIEWSQNRLDPASKAELDDHIATCQQCAYFNEHVHQIQQGIRRIKAPEPPRKLLERTGARCHQELLSQSEEFNFETSSQLTFKTPKLIWAALGMCLALIIVWAFPILKEFARQQIVTPRTFYVFTIIIQNILMLLFAPILLRSMKIKISSMR